jgi:hypothetical protein
MSEPTPTEDIIKEMLINADAAQGGGVGIWTPPEEEALARSMMTARGLIGPKGFLTKQGATVARRLQHEFFEGGESA